MAHVSSRLLDTLREIGRLTGELRLVSGVTVNNNTINFLGHPAFTAMQEGLLRIARAHPQAKGDIIALLRDLDARDGSLPGDSLRPVIEQSSGDSLRPTACGRFEAVDVG